MYQPESLAQTHQMLLDFSYGNLRNHHMSQPEHSQLRTDLYELRLAASRSVQAVAECFESRKRVYLTQLRKIREISNMATRNAVQV